jgi:hypothetical protein
MLLSQIAGEQSVQPMDSIAKNFQIFRPIPETPSDTLLSDPFGASGKQQN